MNEEITTITIDISKSKKGKFKSACASNDDTMKLVLTGAIEDYIIEHGGNV